MEINLWQELKHFYAKNLTKLLKKRKRYIPVYDFSRVSESDGKKTFYFLGFYKYLAKKQLDLFSVHKIVEKVVFLMSFCSDIQQVVVVQLCLKNMYVYATG